MRKGISSLNRIFRIAVVYQVFLKLIVDRKDVTRNTKKNNLLAKYPQIKDMWHPDNDKEPEEYTFRSNVRRKFKCPACNHEWTATITNMTVAFDKGTKGCPGCHGLSVSSANNLLVKCPQIEQVWHPGNEKGIEEHVSGTHQKAKFKCPAQDVTVDL